MPDRWNPYDSRTKKTISEEIHSETCFIYDETLEGKKIVPNTLMGTLMNDRFYAAFRDVQHETEFTVDFFAIEKADNDFISSYDGYIGIAPYSHRDRSLEHNFLYQLQ